jgi:MFS family permease
VKRFAQRYVEFVRQPDVAPLLAVALVARMPVGMVGFAMLMFLRESLGDFTRAGTAAGINFIAMAAVGPVIGRLIDRHGPRWPLIVTGIVQPLAPLRCSVSAPRPSFPWSLPRGAAGMFATPPPRSPTTWRTLRARDDRRTAFALDAVMIEINFTLGPPSRSSSPPPARPPLRHRDLRRGRRGLAFTARAALLRRNTDARHHADRYRAQALAGVRRDFRACHRWA